MKGGFDRLAAPRDLTHQHRTRRDRKTEIGHFVRIDVFREPALSPLLDEKSGQPVRYEVVDQAEIVANQRIVLCDSV